MSHHSWVRWPKTAPIWAAFSILFLYGLIPFTEMLPPDGFRMPLSILIVVDLPAPFGPT
ncbi:hypothetical protein D3C80_1924530 [compost metagenome]